MNLVSRIALIAYVVGGWLLPAMHHHSGHSYAQHVGSASLTCCSGHGCEAAFSTPDSHQDHGSHHGDAAQCCHDHDHCDVVAASNSAPSKIHADDEAADHSNAVLYAVDSGDPHACVGLCALCAAQSLIGQTVANSTSSLGEITLVDRIGLTGNGWPLRVQRGGISSRGPPAIL